MDDPLNAPPNFVPFLPKYNAHIYQHTKLSKYRVPDNYFWSSRKSSETEMKYYLPLGGILKDRPLLRQASYPAA